MLQHQIEKAISDLRDIQKLTNMDRVTVPLESEKKNHYVASHVIQSVIDLLEKLT